MGLVQGNVPAQAVLEDILEEVKPQQPAETSGLHWLLATPFRYRPLPPGSRFRRSDDPGVFYGAEERKTACAESGYWRLRFWRDSAHLSGQSKAIPITLFEFTAATRRALDLTLPPLVDYRELWTDPAEYTATQDLAETARQIGIETIRYESVRNPGGRCLAMLSPAVFKAVREPFQNHQEGWNILIQPPRRIVWQRDLEREMWAFDFPEG